MTLEEAVKWHEDKEAEYKALAKEHEDFAMMAVHYQQLAGWLKEVETLREDVETWSKNATSLQLSYNELLADYKKAKQLLKLAVEDLHYLESHTVDEEGRCLISDNRGKRILCSDCPFYNNGKVNEKCIWNYEAEALKLIGDEEE